MKLDWLGETARPRVLARAPLPEAATRPIFPYAVAPALPPVDWMAPTARPRPAPTVAWADSFTFVAIVTPGPPPPTPYPGIKAAVAAYWDAHGLTQAVGPIYSELPPASTPPPYATLYTIDTRRFSNFTKSYFGYHWLQVSAFGNGEADARTRGEAAMLILDGLTDTPAALALTFGTVSAVWNESFEPTVTKLPGTNVLGGTTYQAVLKYRFMVSRARQ